MLCEGLYWFFVFWIKFESFSCFDLRIVLFVGFYCKRLNLWFMGNEGVLCCILRIVLEHKPKLKCKFDNLYNPLLVMIQWFISLSDLYYYYYYDWWI